MNKKYRFLDDEEKLKEQLKVKSVMELAKELSELIVKENGLEPSELPKLRQTLHGCITYRKNRWSEEEKAQVKRQRKA
jgi:hypothetical protein